MAEDLAQTYTNRVSELAQLQQSQLRGQAMATCDFLTATNGNWSGNNWRMLGVDLAYEEPIKLTPIQEMRAGLKSWLNL